MSFSISVRVLCGAAGEDERVLVGAACSRAPLEHRGEQHLSIE